MPGWLGEEEWPASSCTATMCSTWFKNFHHSAIRWQEQVTPGGLQFVHLGSKVKVGRHDRDEASGKQPSNRDGAVHDISTSQSWCPVIIGACP